MSVWIATINYASHELIKSIKMKAKGSLLALRSFFQPDDILQELMMPMMSLISSIHVL